MERFTHQPNEVEIFQPDILKKLVHKTQETNDSYSISMQPFIDLYGLETVKSDYSKIADRLLTHFDHKLSGPEKMGHIFENAFLDIGSRGHWFGEKSELTKASKFDDIMNGVDMIATIVASDDNARHLAIASDLTFSFPGVSEKFNKILNGVRQGKMAQVKYFNSELLHITGQLRNIPRTVVGLDVENLNNFLLRWIKEPELAQLQYGGIMLNQISTQSRAFAAVAGKKQELVSNTYNRAADIIDEVLTREYKGIEMPHDKLGSAVAKHSERLLDEYS
jgi:hypothetical protein